MIQYKLYGPRAFGTVKKIVENQVYILISRSSHYKKLDTRLKVL